ncbi:MAG: hypothetical protein KIT22_05740 [Verrucomicrobiae bacterium]|nr:hypothetical protein [Verrucomicrobiae bacterium]
MTPVQQIRLRVDRLSTAAMIDDATSNTPTIFRGTDIEFAFAIFRGDELQPPSSLAPIASITLEVKRRDGRPSVALMSRTIGAGDLNLAMTEAQWESGDGQHGLIAFSAAETALDLGDADETAFHLVLAATTGELPSRRITLGISTLTIIEDGTPFGQLPPGALPDDYYTKDEADARYLQAVDEAAQNAEIATKIPLAEKGVPNGVATLDADGRVPITQLPQSGTQYIPAAQKGAAGGVASLNASAKVPLAQLPAGQANGVPNLDATGKVPTAQLPSSLPGGPYVPTSQKGLANGVASLGSDGKVPESQLPPAQAGGPFVPVSSVGVATGVASLGSDGKVPASQLPATGGVPAGYGMIMVSDVLGPLPDVVANPALKNYLIIRRASSDLIGATVTDEYLLWNEGDGGSFQRWQPPWQPTRIPLPIIEQIKGASGVVNIGAWPAPGSSAQTVVRYTVNGADPNLESLAGPVYPQRHGYGVTTSGAAWTDGSGTHYRFVVKARAYAPGLNPSILIAMTFSVQADGSWYADY